MEVINKIKEEMIELKFNVNSKGMIFWLDAIKIIKESPILWSMGEIYEGVAELNKSTVSRVERAMRTAIEPAKKNIQQKYKYYDKITNKIFLQMIRMKLLF